MGNEYSLYDCDGAEFITDAGNLDTARRMADMSSENFGGEVFTVRDQAGKIVYTAGQSRALVFIWVKWRDLDTGKLEAAWQPHMTFERTVDGLSDADAEIEDLRDSDHKAKFGKAFA